MKILQISYREMLRRLRPWMTGVLVLAGVWAIAGAVFILSYPQIFPILLESIQKMFDQLIGPLDQQTDRQIAAALLRQNSQAAAYGLFGGILLGIFPAISIAFNFFLLGFLAGPFFNPDAFGLAGVSAVAFILAVAPHGIFELPALWLAAAGGLQLGWRWLLPGSAGGRWEVFKRSFYDALLIAPLVGLLLVIAAFVEAFVTSRLV